MTEYTVAGIATLKRKFYNAGIYFNHIYNNQKLIPYLKDRVHGLFSVIGMRQVFKALKPYLKINNPELCDADMTFLDNSTALFGNGCSVNTGKYGYYHGLDNNDINMDYMSVSECNARCKIYAKGLNMVFTGSNTEVELTHDCPLGVIVVDKAAKHVYQLFKAGDKIKTADWKKPPYKHSAKFYKGTIKEICPEILEDNEDKNLFLGE